MLELLSQAQTCHQTGDWQQAEQLYRQILQQHPTQPEALHGLGLLACQFDAPDVGRYLLLQSILESAEQGDFYLNLGHVYYDSGQGNAAVVAYQQALTQQDNVMAHERLGTIFINSRLFEEALPHFLFLIQQTKPANPRLHNTLGNIFRELGRLDEALEHYQQALQIKPDYAISYFNLGQIYLMLEQLNLARASFENALQIDPDFVPARETLTKMETSLSP